MTIKYKTIWERCFPEFTACSESAVKSLMESSELVKLSAGALVFSPGSECLNYLLLVEGAVKAQLISENGREMLLYRVLPGDSCVLTTSCLLSGDFYPAEGIAESDSSAFVIPAHAFNRCLEKSVFFREYVFRNFSKRLSAIIGRFADVSLSAIEQRLANELLSFSTTQIRITHQQLAIRLGSAREVVSRRLKQFEVNGWVSLNRGNINIENETALRKLTESR